jgi:hypothetical protein
MLFDLILFPINDKIAVQPAEELYAEYGHVDYGMSLYEFDGQVNFWYWITKGFIKDHSSAMDLLNSSSSMRLWFDKIDERAKV